MWRDGLFRSGVPTMIAGICFLALAYVGMVRRERLAVYWASAWALLVARYVWSSVWGIPYPTPWIGSVAAMMRVGFAMTILAGTFALRGDRFRVWLIPVVAIGVALGTELLGSMMRSGDQNRLNLGVMLFLLLIAAWRLATANPLPRFERAAASIALAVYGLASFTASQLPDGGAALGRVTMLAWASQLLVGLSILATFFRLSYDAELAARRTVEQRLTQALSGFVHICMHCKAVRDQPEAQWQKLETFVAERTQAVLSHGLCDECAESYFPDETSGRSAAVAGA
ncbi:hypothetical protein [Gemmatimonas groenlandica]|uniref:Uncharacterized protein n=1 Tax=Gemmatimonas groenlandica TaxID=2732249 RepID=A0A6M4IWF5_9BACT|nr:hypothetical protein [Gemmatimonas groenlandica]QJR38029.1 hypothetical protein HKW67_22105 [Gemmatimonas groenlandica]